MSSRFCHTVESDAAVAELLRNARQPARLGAREASKRQSDADPVEAGLLLRMHANMRLAILARARSQRLRRRSRQGAAEFFFDEPEKFVEAEGVEHIFQPRLRAIGPVAMFNEDAQNLVGDLDRLVRRHDDASIAREVLVTSYASQSEAEINSRFDAMPGKRFDRLKADVVGVFQRPNAPRAVEGDIEFARQPGERTVVKNMVVHGAREGTRVDEFPRVNARRRRARYVANIVGAGALAPQPGVLHGFDDLDGVLGLDFAQLNIGARRYMQISAATGLR